jgi:hypothetical protein
VFLKVLSHHEGLAVAGVIFPVGKHKDPFLQVSVVDLSGVGEHERFDHLSRGEDCVVQFRAAFVRIQPP